MKPRIYIKIFSYASLIMTGRNTGSPCSSTYRCAFNAITKLIQIPRLGCYFLVILFSDVMTIHFFFLVRNTGSWMEIGNSISHFGIVSAQVVFVLLLFALTNIYTKDIQTRSVLPSSRKAL